MKKLNMQTPDLTAGNIAKIAELFPNVITEKEGKDGAVEKAVDFDLLRQALQGGLVEGDDERYRLDWPGKRVSLLKANTPIQKTLRPDKESSVNFDATQNLFIEGDNFEVLKILQESYLGKVKMIYIDPPYNTGKDFVYRDNFTTSKDEYEEELGVEDEEGGKLFRNTDTNGRFHSDWLSMMYERLTIARDLLKDDGMIFISIDDNEQANLKKICDEIFGEGNLAGVFVWNTKNAARGVPPKTMLMSNHEYVHCYGKDIEKFKLRGEDRKEEDFANPDNDPRGLWRSESIRATGAQDNEFIISDSKTGNEHFGNWAFSKTRIGEMIKEGLILFPDNQEGTPRQKKFIDSYLNDTKAIVTSIGWYSTENSTKALMDLFGGKKMFDFPKPLELITFFVKQATRNEDILIDFFSGSATTAHAVLAQNVEDGGKRRFVMVQISEETPDGSEARKAGYKTIAEIGKERIRRAGKKILEENRETLKERVAPLDVGFRVYKTDTTNMKDVYYHPSELKQESLLGHIDNVKDDRTPEDLLTQVILDLGLELSLPIEQKKIQGNTVYFVQGNALVACFDEAIDFGIVDEIAKLEPLKVIFRDSCFKEEQDRTNVETRFKRLSPDTVITVL